MPSNTISPQRASALRLELPSPSDEVVIPPPGLGQLAAAMRLDPTKGPDLDRVRLVDLLRRAADTLGLENVSLAVEIGAALGREASNVPEVESDRTRVQRILRQAKLLFGPEHAHLAEELPMRTVGLIVHALYLVAGGIDPADAVAVQEHLQRLRDDPRDAAAMAADLDNLTVELAARLEITPAEAAKMSLVEALSLRAKLAENEHADAKFQAALVGIKL